MKKVLAKASVIGSSLVPFVAFADIQATVQTASDIVGSVIPLMFAIALVVFLWGLIQYLRAGDSDKGEARSHMLWGIVILTVMAAVWGLVDLLAETVDVQTGGTIDIPDVPTS